MPMKLKRSRGRTRRSPALETPEEEKGDCANRARLIGPAPACGWEVATLHDRSRRGLD
jgi:hypothetical protein